MKKSLYIFIGLLLSISFWELSVISSIFSKDTISLFTWLWSLLALPLYNKGHKIKSLYSAKYIQYMYWILLGVFISMFSAYFFWGQKLIVSFYTQRAIYCIIMLPAILYIQPSENDIIKSLKWITIGTMIIWILSIINPGIINIREDLLENIQHRENTDLGVSIRGIRYVVLYFYILVMNYMKKFSIKTFMYALFIFTFILLFQNRSLLIGASLIFIYSIFKIRSKYKPVLMLLIIGIILFITSISKNIWLSLFQQTQGQLADPDYNRWKAIHYYIFEHSPNWFCYIFGNGFASLNTTYGQYIEKLRSMGIFAVDIGLIGLWANFGLIPILIIYKIILNLILKKEYPLFLKFISFHILLIPTIFTIQHNPHIMFFSIIIYLYAYYKEINYNPAPAITIQYPHERQH